MILRSIREQGLIADLFCEDPYAAKPAVILLGGSEGGKAWSDTPEAVKLLGELVERGFTVFSLAYFGMDDLPTVLANIPLEYFETAFAWLAVQPEVIPNQYALVGGSKGGELALLLGSRYPQVKAVVGFVPSSVVFQGLSRDKTKSSWSYQERELPFVRFPFSALFALLKGMRSGQFLEVYTRALRNKTQVTLAAIPVENINGPILLISGTQDEMWPSTLMCEQMMARLSEARFRCSYEHLAWESGHNVADSKDFWPKVTGFLKHEFLKALAEPA